MIVKDTKQLGSFRRGINLYVPRRKINILPNIPMPEIGPKLWLQADAGVTYDGSNNVISWEDQSGNDNNATPVTLLRPTYQTNIINGKPVIRFSPSTDRRMSLTNDIGGEAFSIFIVCKNNDNTDGSMFLWATDENFGKYIGIVTASSYNIDGRNRFIFSQSDVGNGLQGGIIAFSDGQANNNFIIGTAIKYQGNPLGEGKAYLNGAGGNNGVGSNLFSDAQYFNLIGGYGYGYELDGDIAEIIAYDYALSTQERQAVENYLNNKYAIY